MNRVLGPLTIACQLAIACRGAESHDTHAVGTGSAVAVNTTSSVVDVTTCPPGATRRQRDVPDPIARDQVIYREIACVLADGTLHGPYELHWPGGVLKERGSYAHGRRTGRWLILGTPGEGGLGGYREGMFVDGEEDGEWRSYSEPGKLAWTGTFRKGKRHGRFEWFFADGARQQAGELFEDQADGTWTFWRPDGTVERTETWSRGKRVH
jgi:hypothetical protein